MTDHSSLHRDAPAQPRLLLRGQGLTVSGPAASPLFDSLSFAISAGLTFVRGGEGRGKTALLRLLSGALQADAGTLEWETPAGASGHAAAAPVFRADFDADFEGSTSVRDWLQQQSAHHSRWDSLLLDELLEGFGLAEHLDKQLHMLSTGSRRKAVLTAAFASGADLTLLEKPFAALDARSRGLLAELLQDAAAHQSRAWVLADYELPAALEGNALASVIDLGD